MSHPNLPAPSLSALMCDGMGWFSNNDFKRMLLLFDRIMYLVPSRTVEFRDENGQPSYILISKELQEAGFRLQHYQPSSDMADAMIHSAKSDAARPTFASIIASIPEAERTYTWRIANADADLGQGSSLGLPPREQVLAHALLLNKFLVAADSAGAVPISGKPYIHALIGEKYRIAQRAKADDSEGPAMARSSLNPIALRIINAILTDQDLEGRSEIEIVEYKDKHRRLFDMFSYTVRRLVKQVSALPDAPDFDRQVSELVNTEVWREKTEVESELRDAWAGFFKSSLKSAIAGAVALGITPFLSLGTLSVASVLAGAATTAPWMTSEIISLLDKRKQTEQHGLYYLMNFIS